MLPVIQDFGGYRHYQQTTLISMAVMGYPGYTSANTRASVALAQVGGFSIVNCFAHFLSADLLSNLVTAITFIALVSIAASSYLIIFSDQLF